MRNQQIELNEKRYKTEDAARILGISKSTLLNDTSARRITYIPGRPNQYPASALKEYLRKNVKRALV